MTKSPNTPLDVGMAIETIQLIYCDPHQERGDKIEGEHFKINLNGEAVKVDLCSDCVTEYLSGLHELMELVNKPKAKKSTAAKKKGPDPAAVRAWAEENGYEVSPRGRVPADVLAAYEAAN